MGLKKKMSRIEDGGSSGSDGLSFRCINYRDMDYWTAWWVHSAPHEDVQSGLRIIVNDFTRLELGIARDDVLENQVAVGVGGDVVSSHRCRWRTSRRWMEGGL